MAEGTIPVPQFVRLEYLQSDGSWFLAHAGINLLHPQRYVERLADRGKVGRATNIDTGEIFQIQRDPCGICDEVHVEPEGWCLLL